MSSVMAYFFDSTFEIVEGIIDMVNRILLGTVLARRFPYSTLHFTNPFFRICLDP
jgi:hypothetical protein